MKILLVLATTFAVTGCGWGDRAAFQIVYPWKSVNDRMEQRGTKQPPDQFGLVELPNGVFAFHSKRNLGSSIVVIYLHGNGESVLDLADTGFLFWLDRIGVDWIAPDYPGMGIGGSGIPNHANNVGTAAFARDWVLRRVTDETHVVVWGRSLGAGVAAQLAHMSPHDVDALVLVSPWTSLRDVVRRNWIGRLFVSEQFHVEHSYDTAAVCTDIEMPTLIVHGERDEIIPFDMGASLSTCFRRGRIYAEPTFGHNGIYGGDALDVIVEFLNAR